MGIKERDSWKFTSSDKLYDDELTEQADAPTLVTDGYEVNSSGKKGPRYLNFAGTIRNAADDGEGAADVWLFPFFYFPAHPGEVKWVAANGIKFHRQAQILADTYGVKGNVYQIVKPAGATRVAWATSASFGADTTLQLVVERDT
jgi:hypothetical protein